MNHWLLDAIQEKRATALREADRVQFRRELAGETPTADLALLHDTAAALEIATLDLAGTPRLADEPALLALMRESAGDAFRLLRALPLAGEPMADGTHLLRASCLAVLGDRGADAARWLRALDEGDGWPLLPLDAADWGIRCRATIVDVWLRLVRKRGWADRDAVLERVAALRQSQAEFERDYLQGFDPLTAKHSAMELIVLYHLAKAAEILAHFITDGVVDGNHQVQQLLDSHFDRALAACEPVRLVELEPLARLLAAAAAQMVENSIWTVTRAVNSRVTAFVRQLVDRGRGDRALFDVLPPQRRTLAERGLLGSSRRAVVVSLPTSGGKTLIAQFRILQAINQFDDQEGWVAYLAPSRALVNQITRQLRRDFEPLGIVVERVSPAMEIDGIEAGMLAEQQAEAKFRVLVTTPEKLDLMLRQGWEAKIGRPLTLVVVDEAHTIQDPQRGLRLELLLATINQECRDAQFLLLTPFINNAREVARWLGGANSDDISLGVDWQPNDRAIGVVRAVDAGPLGGRSRDYRIEFKTVHTTRHTIDVAGSLDLAKVGEIAASLSRASNAGTLAALATQKLKDRGPVIAMHSRPDYVWALADKLRIAQNRSVAPSAEVHLVQEYVASEMGADFPLVDLLAHGIGVHHAGLPEEVRMLMEWLFEKGCLEVLAATTTIAQGVNFPVSGVVMAATQYPYGNPMPPEDFWNIAGRAGRVSQGQLGVVAVVADSEARARAVEDFIRRNTGDLNSALIQLAQQAGDALDDLGKIVYHIPEWSSFLQYLAHTYRQMGQPSTFAEQIELVLRGTLGFERLRATDSRIARKLLDGITRYTEYLQRPGQPLALVDSTGFSLQSIITVMSHRTSLGADCWNRENLFQPGNRNLQDMMGVLLSVPELRENLKAATGGHSPDGNKLARILKDWVGGVDIPTIAATHFQDEGTDLTTALTKCGQNLFGKLTHTASWGLGALLAITGQHIPEDERPLYNNLASRVFHGVASDEAITLRLLGVPRRAAMPLAASLGVRIADSLPETRRRLSALDERQWIAAMGASGSTYRKVWRIIEGIEG
jgi:hypothetical protein